MKGNASAFLHRKHTFSSGALSAPRIVAACFAVVLAALQGCTPSSSQIERALEKRLPDLVGPAAAYDVEIDGLQARSGAAQRVTAKGERVRPEGAPTLDQLSVTLHGIVYDRKRERLERVDSTRATAVVTKHDLAAFVEGYRDVREASVELHPPDQMTLRVRPDVGDLPLLRGLDVEVDGRTEVVDGRLHVDISRVSAGGASVGGLVLRYLSRALNPLVDLSELPLDLQVTGVDVEEDMIRLFVSGEGVRTPQSTPES